MSYEKNVWVTGDVITADKLNHIENGISLTVPVIIASFTADNVVEINASEYTLSVPCVVKYEVTHEGVQYVFADFIVEHDSDTDRYFVSGDDSSTYYYYDSETNKYLKAEQLG